MNRCLTKYILSNIRVLHTISVNIYKMNLKRKGKKIMDDMVTKQYEAGVRKDGSAVQSSSRGLGFNS